MTRIDKLLATLAEDLRAVRAQLATLRVPTSRPEVPAPGSSEERRRERLVARLLADLLSYRMHLASQRGAKSAAGAALRAIESGVHGTGGKGTKGVGMADRPDPEVRAEPAPCAAEERYWSRAHLPWHWLRKHLVEAQVSLASPCTTLRLETLGNDGGDGVALSVEQYVGWRCATPEQAAKWWAKLEGTDTSPALEGMRAAGAAALVACAEEYFG